MSHTTTPIHAPHGKEHPPSIRELLALATHNRLSGEDLDEAVYDAACAQAAAVNNKGLDAQVEYLVRRFGAREAQRRIERASDERAAAGVAR